MNRFLTAAFALAIAAAPAATADTLNIDVTNIKSATGKVLVALFDANGFAANKSLRGAVAEVTGDTVRVSFEGVAPVPTASKSIMTSTATENSTAT